MTFQEYHLQTRRTLPDLDTRYGINHPQIMLCTSTPLQEGLLESIHMVLGMFSEIDELSNAVDKGDVVNIAEELTDILWYASNYAFLRQIDISGYQFPKNGTSFEIDLCVSISRLTDPIKKFFAYTRQIAGKVREKEIQDYFDLLDSIGQFAAMYNIDLEKSCQNNIDKLRVRFPDKFDIHKAQDENRNLDIERKELEK